MESTPNASEDNLARAKQHAQNGLNALGLALAAAAKLARFIDKGGNNSNSQARMQMTQIASHIGQIFREVSDIWLRLPSPGVEETSINTQGIATLRQACKMIRTIVTKSLRDIDRAHSRLIAAPLRLTQQEFTQAAAALGETIKEVEADTAPESAGEGGDAPREPKRPATALDPEQPMRWRRARPSPDRRRTLPEPLLKPTIGPPEPLPKPEEPYTPPPRRRRRWFRQHAWILLDIQMGMGAVHRNPRRYILAFLRLLALAIVFALAVLLTLRFLRTWW